MATHNGNSTLLTLTVFCKPLSSVKNDGRKIWYNLNAPLDEAHTSASDSSSYIAIGAPRCRHALRGGNLSSNYYSSDARKTENMRNDGKPVIRSRLQQLSPQS